jgi:hypothetical protein
VNRKTNLKIVRKNQNSGFEFDSVFSEPDLPDLPDSFKIFSQM